MIEASADVALGEAIRPAARAHERIYRVDFLTILLAALALAGCAIASSLLTIPVATLGSRFQFLSWVIWIVGTFAGLAFALRIYARRHLDGFLGSLRRMGSPEVFPTRFRFDESGIDIDNDRLSHRIAWQAVHFMLPTAEHWLIQVDTMTLVVPRRAFADTADEQAFLDLAAAQMSDVARGRSVLANQ